MESLPYISNPALAGLQLAAGSFNLVCLREEIKQRTATAFGMAVAIHA
jgi:hypothetical protein